METMEYKERLDLVYKTVSGLSIKRAKSLLKTVLLVIEDMEVKEINKVLDERVIEEFVIPKHEPKLN